MAEHGLAELDGDTLRVEDGLELRLRVRRRHRTPETSPVLLLHGASAASQTFEFPRDRSLVDYLMSHTNLEPWLLDWRCSKNVTEPYRTQRRFDDRFTYDGAAGIDIPAALRQMRTAYPHAPLRVIGHCMGAETLSRAVAGGQLPGDLKPDRVVLSAIGLFYEVAVDGRLKADDHLLERLQVKAAWGVRDGVDERNDFVDPTCRDDGTPRNPWPMALEEMYEAWPRWLRPHGEGPANGRRSGTPKHVVEMCNRVSFMFGEPYYEPALAPEIHCSPTELPYQFGMMPLKMYVHAAQGVRRGWAAPFDGKPDDDSLISDAARRRFDSVKTLLITGAMNRLWHRDSVDRMYEWLKRGKAGSPGHYKKIVFSKNGHQDLLWGTNAWKDIFPQIAEWLI